MTPFSAEEMASAVSELAKLKKIPITVYMKDGGAKLEEKIRALSERIDFTRKNGFAPSQLSLAVSSPAMARLKIQKQLQIDQHREKMSAEQIVFQNFHRSLANRPKPSDKEVTPAQLTVSLLPHQETGLKWLLFRENEDPAGGILADDMGMGKTITLIALILRHKELAVTSLSETSYNTAAMNRCTGTLIVCPPSVVGIDSVELKQIVANSNTKSRDDKSMGDEIHRRCKKNCLKVAIYHGSYRNQLDSKLHQYDVVITTYQTAQREIDGDAVAGASSKSVSVLLKFEFERIILDEAHTVRNPNAAISLAVSRIRARKRWAVTGTPVQNNQSDFYSLLRFIGFSPLNDLSVWKKWITAADVTNDKRKERLKLITEAILLRRTKGQSKDSSNTPLVDLPAKNVHNHEVILTREEDLIYQKILTASRKALSKKRDMEKIFVHLLRLRQVCCHASLAITEVPVLEDGIDIEPQSLVGDVNLRKTILDLSTRHKQPKNV